MALIRVQMSKWGSQPVSLALSISLPRKLGRRPLDERASEVKIFGRMLTRGAREIVSKEVESL